MATCGYICPKCEGAGFNSETLEACDWCKISGIDKSKLKLEIQPKTISDEEWIEKVHAQNCCSDIGNTNEV